MVQYKILERIANIQREYDSVQINLMKWGNNTPKYDIRKWSDEEEPQKGFTLSEEELRNLYDQLHEFFGNQDPIMDDFDEESDDNDILDYRKFLVYGNVNECESLGHDCEEIDAVVYVYRNGREIETVVNAVHCFDCNAYYISESSYMKLKEMGIILCQVFSAESFEKYKNGCMADDLNEENILHRTGYNVNKTENLSEDTRHVILEYVIDNGILEKKADC